MIYPEFIKKNDTIGICAPSAGVGKKLDDFDKSLSVLKSEGYNIKETRSVRINNIRSADGITRARECESLFKDKDVDMVICAAGGDFLNEMLPYVDFEILKNNPKWLMGHSDPTGLLFPYTIECDVASIYGMNAGGFDYDELYDFLKINLKMIKGENIIQNSYDMCMKTPTFLADTITFDTPVVWESDNVETLNVSGRCIGGCLDCLKDLIGTPICNVQAFVEKYKDDGQIWYFDVFSMSAEVVYRTLCQMKFAGWFKYTKAILLGRVLLESTETGMTYEEGLQRAFPDIPAIYNCDIGHTLPNMTMINGAILHLDYHDKKATLQFELIE
ncbi:MAG: LD-carboxypeptidase [Holdemanella sp.]|nr:LD-carboxypeptidase [Holdemanella sp.]